MAQRAARLAALPGGGAQALAAEWDWGNPPHTGEVLSSLEARKYDMIDLVKTVMPSKDFPRLSATSQRTRPRRVCETWSRSRRRRCTLGRRVATTAMGGAIGGAIAGSLIGLGGDALREAKNFGAETLISADASGYVEIGVNLSR